MDENTQSNIASNARHALVEIEGILKSLDNPEYLWHCLGAANSRLGYIEELLRTAGHTPPSQT